jgi:hypothetical protein
MKTVNDIPEPRQVAAALPRIMVGLQKYSWLQENLQLRDVSSDAEYQRRFAGFYRVRRDSAWRRVYFNILEGRKATQLPFGEALRLLEQGTGRIEASFASKLVATIDPQQPVIDSVVFKNLDLRLPARSMPDRISQLEDVYRRLSAWYHQQLATTQGREVVAMFRAAYPGAKVTDIKALDLVLWQIRAE